ncbi:MotA/TolQ/ExbB proton channel family protein [Undibacterium sp. Jales W-56]|uniref:MotA/TolQ/ExbB proton channel family protein n=1 Tax=Undibacterium sp. Jales W-56 TaxID=2897325 RepID=UPI0021D1933D|nr:MotA/TolQ/ExbB proton channel family protein [Undibacterium sp. Jales W-56]MCU6435864.1 MotA/TolQ/ExbB proton channel family protein [Undibacterium sp. Jales W-56]
MKFSLKALLAAAVIALTAHAAIAQESASAAATAAPAAAAPADAPAAPAAEGAAPAEVKDKVDNPYGLDALWKTGDFVAKGTLIIMFIMSMGSWYILITKIVDQIKLSGQAKDAQAKFWKAPSVNAGITSLKEGSPFRFIAESATKASDHHEGALLEQIDLNSWISMSIQRAVEKVQSRLQDGLAFLATVGSTAPFVGLFGTVWGIYHALTAIGIAGQASIDKVAGPVGEALIMTAIGLAVAVPAVLGYNFLVRRNKSAMENVRAFSADLHSVVLSGVMSKKA